MGRKDGKKRHPQHRAGRRERARKSRAEAAAPVAPQKTYPHPLYGAIPLVELAVEWEGRTYTHDAWDLTYEPKLPTGAVRGNPSAQELASHDPPKYFYVDDERRCEQCGKDFTFWAAEQKFWYETLRVSPYATAVRCVSCRRCRRTQKAATAELVAAREQLRSDPDNPAMLLELARTLVQQRELSDSGDLDDAIAAARKARRLARTFPRWSNPRAETYLWEGHAQRLSGRESLARTALTEYLHLVTRRGRHTKLVRQVEVWLAGGCPRGAG